MRFILQKFFAYFIVLWLGFKTMDVVATPFSSVSYNQLNDRVSVIFIDTGVPDSLLVMMCVATGVADEIEHRGIANLFSHVFLQKLKHQADTNNLQYGAQSNAYAGYDQSVYYFYGKPENLEEFIKSFGKITEDFSCTERELENAKKIVEQTIKNQSKIDKFSVQKNAMRSLFWHAGYGNDINGEIADVSSAIPEYLADFYKNYYRRKKITFLIVGRVNNKKTIDVVQKYFGQHKWKEKFLEQKNQLKEPKHHGSTAQIVQESEQTDVVMLNFYWKIASYYEDKVKALADEVFISYLGGAITQQLVEQQKLVSSMSFSHISWNKACGYFCVTVTAGPTSDLDLIKFALSANIRCLASKGMTQEQVNNHLKKIITNANFYKMDVMDAVDWISKRVSAGYSWDYLKSYAKSTEKIDAQTVNVEAKKVFINPPDVISILKPKGEKNAL